MDPITQAALGAVTGQAVGHRPLGRRALIAGAIAGAAPDIDVLFSIGGDWFDELVLHRGITHSLFFAPVVGPLAGLLLARALRASADERRAYIRVITLALLSHPLLDVLTAYGTQLLMPFSDARFAINAMPIIDPVYTLLLLLGIVIAAPTTAIGRGLRQLTRNRLPAPAGIAAGVLLLTSLYLGWGAYLTSAAEAHARGQLANELTPADLANTRVAAFPTLLQLHYRRVVVRTTTDDRVGYLSLWRPCTIDWQIAPRADSADESFKQALLATREGRIFDWFTMGWLRLTPPSRDGTRLGVDLRYGFGADPDASLFAVAARFSDPARTLLLVEPSAPVFERSSASLVGLLASAYPDQCGTGAPSAG
jgi:inner membrane protein